MTSPRKKEAPEVALACPAPVCDYPEVTMAHGAGGALTKRLIEELFTPLFQNELLAPLHDSAVIENGGHRTAFTTDSYVVNPLFFPGGDIGQLAVNGTINDLAMSGARPQHLSLGLIIEEGLSMATLWRLAQSVAAACHAAGVAVVTGDTKVVDRGKGDGMFINCAGIGIVETKLDIGPRAIRPGDAIILSGDIGRHGVAVLSARAGLEFETVIESDCAPLHQPVLALLNAGAEIHCLRDLTRGGLATALIELATPCGADMTIREEAIDVHPAVEGATEILGLDPLYIANEGRFIVVAPARETEKILAVLSGFEVSAGSRVIGVVEEGSGLVACRTPLGGLRPLDLLTGEQMPRIC